MFRDAGPNRQRDDDLRIELAGRLFSDMDSHADVVLHRQMLKMLLNAAGGNDRRLKLALCQRFTKLTPGKVAHKNMLILHSPFLQIPISHLNSV